MRRGTTSVFLSILLAVALIALVMAHLPTPTGHVGEDVNVTETPAPSEPPAETPVETVPPAEPAPETPVEAVPETPVETPAETPAAENTTAPETTSTPQEPAPEPPANTIADIADYGTADDITTCGNLVAQNNTLTTDISASGDCFTFTLDNSFLDCNGYSIIDSFSGSGVIATSRNNVTVKNCVISNFDYNIWFDDTNTSLVVNTSAQSPNQQSIHLSGSYTDRIINVSADAGNSAGIYLSLSNNNTLTGLRVKNVVLGGLYLVDSSNNTITNLQGTSTTTDYGITVTHTGNVYLSSNNRLTNVSADSYGGILLKGTNNTLAYSTGSGSFNAGLGGISVAGDNNQLINVTGYDTASGVTGSGLFINDAIGTIIINSTFIGSGDASAASISTSTDSNFTNSTLITNATWLLTDASSNVSMTGMRFASSFGGIRLLPRIGLPLDTDISATDVNISLNHAFVNSVGQPLLNASANILFTRIPLTNPAIIVDINDDLVFSNCSSARCTKQSFDGSILNHYGGNFAFNVTSFSEYYLEDIANSTLKGMTDCGTLNTTSSTLTTDITINLTGTNQSCLIFTQDNSLLDCNGHTVYMRNNGSVILGEHHSNLTVQNCVIRSQNATQARGINFTDVNDTLIINNDILVNGSKKFSSKNLHYGVFESSTLRSRIVNNNIAVTVDNTSYSHDIYFRMENHDVAIIGNNLTLRGENAEGNNIYFKGNFSYDPILRDIQIINNTMTNYDYDFSHGVDLEDFIDNVTLSGNRIILRGQYGNYMNGFEDVEFSSNITLTNNVIDLFAPHGGSYGIHDATDGTGYTITGNNITFVGNDSIFGSWGIQVLGDQVIEGNYVNISNLNGGFVYGIYPTGTNARVRYNTIAVNGTGTVDGLHVGAQTSDISFNSVVADGTATVTAMSTVSGSNDIFNGNNLTVLGTASATRYALYPGTNTNTFNGTRLIADDVAQPFFYQAFVTDTILTNTSFESSNGSIRILGSVLLPDTQEVILNATNIYPISNAIFLNSSDASATFLNGSAVLTFRNLAGLVNPEPGVSYESNGVFVSCPASRCTFISYSGDVYVMNVSGFSTYEIDEGVPPDDGGGGGGGCSDECSIDEVDCHGNTAITCGNTDQDSCTEIIENPCAPTEPCSAGQCLSCAENWVCSGWSTCINKTFQNRTCEDNHHCGTNATQPANTRPCPRGGGGGGSNPAIVVPVVEEPTPVIEKEEPFLRRILPSVTATITEYAVPGAILATTLGLIIWPLIKKHHQKHHKKGKGHGKHWL
ncbi:MAG TPA: right-handed parallel beta-helix repeat-containing protein [Candidatus Binatia bacterium]|nr:right-handed parallel beta-helix repeat-containing protein [Candidatus Binatia bacterium]